MTAARLPGEAVVALFPELDVAELELWVARGWVRPDPAEPAGWVFEEVDIARVRLILDLRRGCDVGADAMPVVLSLLDQLYDMRARLSAVLGAVAAQPPAVQQAVRAALGLDAPEG